MKYFLTLILMLFGALTAAMAEPPQGVVPVTWEVSPEHPMIDTPEARELYHRIRAEDYPSMEELKAHPVVQQLDALSDYYSSLYGKTSEIETEERSELRKQIMDWFLTLGSARTERIDENGRHHYVYDGPLRKEYKMLLVLELPAAGKSTFIADPRSEEMSAFIMDVDMIKSVIPEYVESHGAAAGCVHEEGMMIFAEAIRIFLNSDLTGTNVILPIVGSNTEEMLDNWIRPFEKAGYNVKVVFRHAKENESAARVVMRELSGGQLIHSSFAFNLGSEGL